MSLPQQPAEATKNITDVASYAARQIRHNHQQLQHVINRILNRLGVPDKAARGISGIHGMLNGRTDLPVFKAHRFTARQLNFRGEECNADTFMCRVLDAIAEAEDKCGRRFFKITRADGVRQKMTSYDADYIGEAALRALLEAKASPEWARNPSRAVTDELIDRAVGWLPEKDPKDPKGDGPSITDDSVIKAQWGRILGNAEKNLVRELESGADPVLAANAHCEKVMRLARSLKANYAREKLRAFSSPAFDVDGEGEGTPAGAAPEAAPAEVQERPRPGGVAGEGPRQTVGMNPQIPQENDPFSEGDLLDAALEWAGQGVAVFPLYGVADGVCDCREGPECRSPGKHPLSRLAPRGVKDATTDPSRIRRWWASEPLANVAVAMGGLHRLLAVDVDPRAGGDASLCDLVEAHGDEWLGTFTVKTGGNGHHFIYRLPAGVEVHRAKLAPGVDVKAEGGYLVAAPSIHASGRRYQVERNSYAAEAPAWLVGELTRGAGVAPAKVIDFQERRAAQAGAGGRIPEGERNRRVFEVGCAIWGQGEAADVTELYRRLLDDVYPRCDAGEKPFTPADVLKIARSIMRYPRGAPAAAGGPGAA